MSADEGFCKVMKFFNVNSANKFSKLKPPSQRCRSAVLAGAFRYILRRGQRREQLPDKFCMHTNTDDVFNIVLKNNLICGKKDREEISLRKFTVP
ncbi:MAG TPA: hypothetical protein VJM08_14450 [Anaerolineales bacterium]|nr:hypothetical protein [Anaerolineales bacterium]